MGGLIGGGESSSGLGVPGMAEKDRRGRCDVLEGCTAGLVGIGGITGLVDKAFTVVADPNEKVVSIDVRGGNDIDPRLVSPELRPMFPIDNRLALPGAGGTPDFGTTICSRLYRLQRMHSVSIEIQDKRSTTT